MGVGQSGKVTLPKSTGIEDSIVVIFADNLFPQFGVWLLTFSTICIGRLLLEKGSMAQIPKKKSYFQ